LSNANSPPFEAHTIQERSISYFQSALEVCTALEFPLMVMTTPFWGWKRVNSGWRHEKDKQMEVVTEVLGTLAAAAKRLAVTLVVEPLCFLETTSVETVADINRLLTDISSDSLCVMLDTGHVHVTAQALGENSIDYFKAYIDVIGEKLRHIHLSDNFGDEDAHLVPGEGSFPFPHAFAVLDSVGYEGYLSMEVMMFGKNPLPPNPEELIVQARDYVGQIK
jgi:sugar phosphate isomerase/epimerase